MPEQTPLQTLFDTLPQTGRVEWIGIRPARGEAMEALESVAVTPGKGLEGDRFKGRETSKRQVTLIQQEHLHAIAWGILAAFIFFPETMIGLFGEITGQHPLFYLAVWAPAISAFVVIFRWSGLEGLRRYIGRTLLWRCSWHWYAFLLLGVPLVFFAGSLLKGNLSDFVFPFGSVSSFLIALVFIAIKGPIEEFGWRGLALPLLQRKIAPIWAALVIGVIWGFWHTPAFLLSGTEQSAWSFLPFFTGTIALSVIVTPLFNASRGSIFLPALFHFILINPVWPDAQPYDTYLFALIAIVIVWLNRRTMFTRKYSITEVVPAGRAA